MRSGQKCDFINGSVPVSDDNLGIDAFLPEYFNKNIVTVVELVAWRLSGENFTG